MMDASHSDTMARVLAALVDERSARRAEFSSVWEAIEAIRLDVRRLAAQQDADRLRGPRPPVCDADVGTDAIVTGRVDVGTDAVLPQPRRDATAQTDAKSKEPRKAAITDLELGLVKHVLQQLDCITLFRARRVCRTWRAAVDDIVAECASANAGRMGAWSAPTSDLHLRLLATRHPITALQAPSKQGQTDLRIVAGACRSLVQANLRGFRFSAGSLRQLISNNASSLETVIMPAVVTNGQLEALLKPLKKLHHLSVSAPSAGGSGWLLALPNTLQVLDVTGPGVTLPPQMDHWYDHLTLHIRAVSDQQLHDLRTIASRVICLLISDCPDVTAAGVALLFSGLTNVMWVDLLAGLDGAVTETALDGLRGCSQLWCLQLGERDRPVTDVPAAAVGRLAVACRELWRLDLYTTPDSCRAVLSALLAVQRDIKYTDGEPRTITLYVPGSVVSELERMASGSRISVYELY